MFKMLWNMKKTKDIKMTSPHSTLDILPGCWPRPHVLTFVKVSKNTQMNFPYHTESILQHVHHFKPIKFFWKKINYFPQRGGGGGGSPFAENSAKTINLIFEPIWQTHKLTDSQLVIFNFADTYRPLMKILVLQNVSHFYHGVQNWFSEHEMQFSKLELEFFIVFPCLQSKNFFYKMFLI